MTLTPEQKESYKLSYEETLRNAEATRASLAAHDSNDWTDLCDEQEQHSLDQAEFRGEA